MLLYFKLNSNIGTYFSENFFRDNRQST